MTPSCEICLEFVNQQNMTFDRATEQRGSLLSRESKLSILLLTRVRHKLSLKLISALFFKIPECRQFCCLQQSWMLVMLSWLLYTDKAHHTSSPIGSIFCQSSSSSPCMCRSCFVISLYNLQNCRRSIILSLSTFVLAESICILDKMNLISVMCM